jgi:hypothetical protein
MDIRYMKGRGWENKKNIPSGRTPEQSVSKLTNLLTQVVELNIILM